MLKNPGLAMLALAAFLVGCGGGGTLGTTTSSGGSTGGGTVTTAQATAGADAAANAQSILAYALEPMSNLCVVAGGSPQGDAGTPKVSVTVTLTTVTVTIDFGTGTTGANGVVRSGKIIVTYDEVLRQGTVNFENYTVDGKTINGTVTLSNISIDKQSASFTLSADLRVPTGHLVGSGTFTCMPQAFTDHSSDFIFTPVQTAFGYEVIATEVSANAAVYGDYIPYSGTLVVKVPYTVSGFGTQTAAVGVTFNTSSPSTGQVAVTIDGGVPFSYTLSGGIGK